MVREQFEGRVKSKRALCSPLPGWLYDVEKSHSMSLISTASSLTRRWYLTYLKVRCRPGRYLEYFLLLSVSALDSFSVEWECWMTLSLMNLIILNMLWLRTSLGFQRRIGQGTAYKENWVSGKSLAQSQCWMLDKGGISTQLKLYEPSWARQPETEKSQGLERPDSQYVWENYEAKPWDSSLCMGRSESRKRLVFIENGRGGVLLCGNLVQG